MAKTREELFISGCKDSSDISIRRRDGFYLDANRLKRLRKALEQNKPLKSLTIRGALYFLNEQNCLACNHLDRKKSCKSLAKLITAHPNLETFDIGDNSGLFYLDIVEIIGALAKHEKIKTVKFDGNNIFLTSNFDWIKNQYLEQRQSPNALDAIIGMPNENKSIEILDLSKCGLTDEDYAKLNVCAAKIKWENPERKLHIIIGDKDADNYQHLFNVEYALLDKGKSGPWSCNVVVLKDDVALPQPVDKSAIYIQKEVDYFYEGVKCSLKLEPALYSILYDLKQVRHVNADGCYALQPRDQELLVASLQHIEKIKNHAITHGEKCSYKTYLDETGTSNLQNAVNKYFEDEDGGSNKVIKIAHIYGILPQLDNIGKAGLYLSSDEKEKYIEKLEPYYFLLPGSRVFFERIEKGAPADDLIENWLVAETTRFGISDEQLASIIDILVYRMERKKDCGALLNYFLALYDAIPDQDNKNKLFDILFDKFLNYSVDSKNNELLKGVIGGISKYLDGVERELLPADIKSTNASKFFNETPEMPRSPVPGCIARTYGKFVEFCEKQKEKENVQELARTMAVQLLKYYSVSCLNNDVDFNCLASLLKIIDKKDLPGVFSSVYLIDRAKFIERLLRQHGKGLKELASTITLCLVSAQSTLEKGKARDSIITFCSLGDVKEVVVWLNKLTTEKMLSEVFGMVKVRLVNMDVQFDKNDFVTKLGEIDNHDLILECLNKAFPDQNVPNV